MDIQEMIEIEKKRQEAAAEEKARVKLRRQIRIFNQEKESYQRKNTHEINKWKRSIAILHQEKDVHLDNYLATQSAAIENKYKKEEAVVKELVRTTGIVKDLLKDETAATKQLEQKITQIRETEKECRKEAAFQSQEREKFKVPNEDKMDRRVEHANARYHTQRQRNIQLQEKIDNAMIMRDIIFKEDARLTKQLNSLANSIQSTMNEASQIYESRDHNEATRMTVTAHLTKVKEQYMSELLSLNSALTEAKDTEAFMRSKQKDIGGFIRERREKNNQKIQRYLSQKDEYHVIFDRIKEAIGKDSIREIIQNFVDTESDNYATFLTIGKLMDDNERMYVDIREMSSSNEDMESLDLDITASQQGDIQAAQNRIASLKQQISHCQKRMEENNSKLDEFKDLIPTLLGVLNLDSERQKFEQTLSTTGIKAALTAIEETIGVMLHDFTMVELATRAEAFSKTTHTPDEVMLMRHPSIRIEQIPVPKTTPASFSKNPDNPKLVSKGNILTREQVKDLVVKVMSKQKTSPVSPTQKTKPA